MAEEGAGAGPEAPALCESTGGEESLTPVTLGWHSGGFSRPEPPPAAAPEAEELCLAGTTPAHPFFTDSRLAEPSPW